MSGTVPAGTIVATGQASGPPAEGWLPCDGSAHAMGGEFADLSAVISWNYGGDGATVFNVPDLRGQFLRGTSHGTQRDPDAGSRTASATGGLTGDNTGSAQDDATTFPTGKPFIAAVSGEHTHSIANVPGQDHHVSKGASGPASWNIMEWNSGDTDTSTDGEHTHVLTGGDAESRPLNIYLDWWIAQHNLDGAPPIGSILAFGGDTTSVDVEFSLMQAGWMVCNGAKMNRNDAKYQPLFAMIGTTYGGDALTFHTPDLRGMFVAGAATPDQVGAVRNKSTTGLPVKPFVTSADGAHSHTIDNVPPDTHGSYIVAGWDMAEANPNTTATSSAGSHTHALTGIGDNETRPINVNIDYIIRYA